LRSPVGLTVPGLAWQDELTGLYNRRRFTELAQRASWPWPAAAAVRGWR
jgi:hypothetical protein